MNDKYTVKDLVETFLNHHEINIKNQQELIDKAVQMGWEPPKKSEFSIALALHVICKKIVELEEK